MARENNSSKLNTESIVGDVDAPGGRRAVVGFIGKSNRKGVIRLYISPSFDNYFEIKRDDVVETCDLDPCASSVGGTVVWVKGSAKVDQFRMRTFEVEATYLEGRRTNALTALRRCCDKDDEDGFGSVQIAATSVFSCGSSSWFLAAPDLPNPWSSSQCESASFGDVFCTWTAEC